MTNSFEETALWKSSVGNEAERKTERLRSSYHQLRRNVEQLVSQISKNLPHLTIHDVTHLDALWETASVLCGASIELNPLEGFVLGAAFLIHDAALCFEAYGGREELQKSLAWQDAYSLAARRNPKSTQAELEKDADFAALRTLHARQAESILSMSWSSPSGSQIFLLEDRELRDAYGPLIGKIAASHHWPMADVLSKLPPQVNSSASLPAAWRINPIKLACIIRCADAAHIDDRRAPDLLFALSRLNGVARDHWLAQNWLSRLDLLKSDTFGQTAVVTSKKKFPRSEASAWWVAFDLLSLLQKELSKSNEVLEAQTPPSSFAIKRVAGTASCSDLTKYIEVDGWTPAATQVHVTNVSSLVQSLGGTNLYGIESQLEISLRELIQNARDAVAARNEIEPGFAGAIWIRHYVAPNGKSFLEICDNGVGMSEDVLLGPLLDFGTSFWSSELVKSEFPGLLSSNFRAVGRFGIGFYSAFMIAKTITVSSRRWDEGIKDLRTLEFTASNIFRPTYSRGPQDSFKSEWSTCITVELKEEFKDISMQPIASTSVRLSNFDVPMSEYLAVICVGLEVPVFYRDKGASSYSQVNTILRDELTTSQLIDWLRKSSFFEYLDPKIRQVHGGILAEAATRMRFVKSSGRTLGLAALNISLEDVAYSATRAVGGFGRLQGRISNAFIGYLEYFTHSAKREPSTLVVPRDDLDLWANEQMKIIHENYGTDSSVAACKAVMSLADMDIDTFIHFRAMVRWKNNFLVLDLEQTVELVRSIGILVAASPYGHMSAVANESWEDKWPALMYLGPSSFYTLKSAYNGMQHPPSSFAGCIERKLKTMGLELELFEVGQQSHPIYETLKVVRLAAVPAGSSA